MQTRMQSPLLASACRSQTRCCQCLVWRNHGLMARSLPLPRGLQRTRCLGPLSRTGVAMPEVRPLLRQRWFGGPEAKARVNFPKAKRLWGGRHRGRRCCNPWESNLRRTRWWPGSSSEDDVDGWHVSGRRRAGDSFESQRCDHVCSARTRRRRAFVVGRHDAVSHIQNKVAGFQQVGEDDDQDARLR